MYAGESAEARMARRREELLDSALTVLARDGREGLSVSGLCASAGLNARYFYESFASTDEVVEILLARLADESIGRAIAQLPSDSPGREDARAGVAAFIDYLTDDPRRGRVLFGAVPAGSAAAQQRDRTLHRFITVASARGRDVYGLQEDPRIDLTAAMMIGGTGQALIDWFDGRIAIERTEFVDELAGTWLALADSMTERIRSTETG